MTPPLRLAALLLAAALGGGAAYAGDAATAQRYIVKYRAAASMRAPAVPANHALLRTLPRQHAAAVLLDAGEAAALAADPAVEYLEPDPVRRPLRAFPALASGADILPDATTGSEQIIPYGIELVRAKGLAGVRRAGVTVCVIDSGYDLGHADMPDASRVDGDQDPLGTGDWAVDGDGHGTHVAGTIGALNNSIGVRGVFPGVHMHIVRVFGNRGGWLYSSDLVAALDRCLDAGADVVNMSLGGGDPSATEGAAFQAARTAGVIAVAAAGNDGDTTLSYPASYASVISVAALDANLQRAPFSNRNNRVTLAAPGVGVLSTVPRGSASSAVLRSPLGTQAVVPMDNFPPPAAPVTGPLVDCGLAGSAAACGDASGAICLIERGTYFFYEKAQSCEAAGGIGALVYNRADETGPVYGTLGETWVSIPVVGTDRATGVGLRAGHLGAEATLDFVDSTSDYAYYSGTSMASPHVAGVAALVWSRHRECTAEEIRAALIATARDLGTSGVDSSFGYGLVRARQADERLERRGCAATP